MSTHSKVLKPSVTDPGPPKVYKPVRKYKSDEISLDHLVARAGEVLSTKPFLFQLEAAAAVLRGEDEIIDVGIGCGKTMCFTLPLLLDPTDISLIVSPLSALMIDQDIVTGKFRQVIVSPEIATSLAFRKSTLSKPAFTSKLRCVCIDEAHCISLWGGSFRPDYADLGVLRGRIPSTVTFVVASATLSPQILDDVCIKLGLAKNATTISLSNARPNESRADLRFLLPPHASLPADIPVTLVYCNQRLATEDGCDVLRRCAADANIPVDCIAFYHAKIGQAQKQNLEERLRKGEIHILFCTDAVGMRVVLWGLPPSFCSLVQRAGRAARDFGSLGKAILIVPSTVIKNGISEAETKVAVDHAATDAESENRGLDAVAELLEQGIEVTSGHEEIAVEEGGIRVSKDSDNEDDETAEVKHKRRNKMSIECNSREADFLSRFACTTKCRRKIWDLFFENNTKQQLFYPENTTYQPLPGTRCCDNCDPHLFEVEKVKIDKILGLKRGRKKAMMPELATAIRTGLMDWREEYLLDAIYPGTTIISAGTVLGDAVIEQLTKERIEEGADLRRHTRWPLGFRGSTSELSEHGITLFQKLLSIYEVYDAAVEAERLRIASLPPAGSVISAASF
ncbi:P-loop containing nucleoside triphosphate hydrolase protein [Mycena olivaceomarginata]|nr:P-loop containing nucleoside triphosphate hydrolase protein [Mycena olivaceomarginata]